jgi:hypothetical protein
LVCVKTAGGRLRDRLVGFRDGHAGRYPAAARTCHPQLHGPELVGKGDGPFHCLGCFWRAVRCLDALTIAALVSAMGGKRTLSCRKANRDYEAKTEGGPHQVIVSGCG